MPRYIFSCNNCKTITEKNISIQEYQNIKTVNNNCNICIEGKLERIFANTNSNIERTLQETIEEIKDDVKKITEKVRSGDIQSMTDIYGEEINQLKNNHINRG